MSMFRQSCADIVRKAGRNCCTQAMNMFSEVKEPATDNDRSSAEVRCLKVPPP
jgi:hypothetical protein